MKIWKTLRCVDILKDQPFGKLGKQIYIGQELNLPTWQVRILPLNHRCLCSVLRCKYFFFFYDVQRVPFKQLFSSKESSGERSFFPDSRVKGLIPAASQFVVSVSSVRRRWILAQIIGVRLAEKPIKPLLLHTPWLSAVKTAVEGASAPQLVIWHPHSEGSPPRFLSSVLLRFENLTHFTAAEQGRVSILGLENPAEPSLAQTHQDLLRSSVDTAID